MALLILSPVCDVYAAIPSFEETTAKFYGLMSEDERQALLQGCEQIIRSHSLHRVVGVDLKHTHFGLSTNQVLVERQYPTEKRAVMKPEEVGSATPFAFYLLDGNWVPYEFALDCPAAVAGLEAVKSCPPFLQELRSFLEMQQMGRFVGFHVLHRDFLENSIETSGDAADELLLRPFTKDLVVSCGGVTHQVMWSWNSPTPRKHLCVHYCGGHTQSCGSHCNSHPSR
jgi:hypothetical protein